MENIICDKVTFLTYAEGIEKLIPLSRRKKKHKFGIYKCEHCGHFHITTITKGNIRPVKKEKYKTKFEIQKQPKPQVQQKIKSRPQQRQQAQTTGKFISAEQAAILKQLINNSNGTIRNK